MASGSEAVDKSVDFMGYSLGRLRGGAMPTTTIRVSKKIHIPLCSIMCEGVRCVSRDRFRERWGGATPQTIAQVEHRLRLLLGLEE